uniref:Uncharacterized protein n=1 Tax=Anguilla anguilla TaxID=7936 RepID=A0A0E9XYM3_ANGAN
MVLTRSGSRSTQLHSPVIPALDGRDFLCFRNLLPSLSSKYCTSFESTDRHYSHAHNSV